MRQFVRSIFHPVFSTLARRRSHSIKLWVPADRRDGVLVRCRLTLDGRYSPVIIEQAQSISGRSLSQFDVTREIRDDTEHLASFVTFAAACRFGEGL